MVSVIVPLYNVEEYIAQCLESIENQIYKDFELIIVNDGSTDNSLALAREFAKNSVCSVNIINQENQGVSKARNTGIEHSKGDFLCFVDSDDMISPYYLETMVSQLEKNKCDVCICNHNKFESECRVFGGGGTGAAVVMDRNEALKKLLFGKIQAGVWALLIRRNVMERLRFAEGYRYSEDLEMVWKALIVSKRAVFVDAPLYGYRYRQGSAMSVVNDKRMDGFALFNALTDFIEENAPSFLSLYKKYGVAKWVWSTVWQEAFASNDYKNFRERIVKYNPKFYLKKLLSYPSAKVSLSSLVFLVSSRLYLSLVSMYRGGRKERIVSDGEK